jgi:hypothetical protein
MAPALAPWEPPDRVRSRGKQCGPLAAPVPPDSIDTGSSPLPRLQSIVLKTLLMVPPASSRAARQLGGDGSQDPSCDWCKL